MSLFNRSAEVWNEPALRSRLEPDETVLAACRAFTGLLAYPLLNAAPMWGSTLWELALTDRRLLAVQHRLLPWSSRGRSTISIPRSDIRAVSVFWDWGLQANVKVVAPENTYEFKVIGLRREAYEFTKQMRLMANELVPTAHG